ncbi:hypothetical protein HWQ46_11070 [Shewanella sp. D64]|uniref:hypothetical protein n=1 Tax=unclassified Shewanella TaxID=196818 RepID=UPI0022BA3064|nr:MULTISPECIES: hypothetical protein [unclassified Shewanella]MEC4726089.1 hypothetical protein [Shewanella sp. D64]MEC4737995.1 hypothetical protein [Shewanella sp. E94]WBJ96194.1 hypothetical protein HWQ47_03410 [Shewanella sp. MTB7]
MSELPILSEEEFKEKFPEIHQQVCDELGMGFVPAIFRCVVVLNPDLALSSWNMVRKNLCSGELPRITKELMFSYIANKKGCNYCMIAHHALALHHGFTGDDMSIILNDMEQIKNPALRLVIKLADASVDNNFDLVARIDEELSSLGFARDEITELVGMISCSLYMVNLADSIGIDIDQRFINTIAEAG